MVLGAVGSHRWVLNRGFFGLGIMSGDRETREADAIVRKIPVVWARSGGGVKWTDQ